MTKTNRRRRRRYFRWGAVLVFVVLPLLSVAYPFFTNCSVASVLVVNRSEQDIAQAVFLFEGTPVRREALAAGEWEWFAVPATPHGEYVNSGYLRVDVIFADGTSPIDEDIEYVESKFPDSHIAEIKAEKVVWDRFASWLVPLSDAGPLVILDIFVDSIPHACACLFGDPMPQPGLKPELSGRSSAE